MIIQGLSLALKGYSLSKRILSAAQNKSDTLPAKAPSNKEVTSGIFSFVEKYSQKTATKEISEVKRENVPQSAEQGFVTSLLERALENKSQAQYSVHLILGENNNPSLKNFPRRLRRIKRAFVRHRRKILTPKEQQVGKKILQQLTSAGKDNKKINAIFINMNQTEQDIYNKMQEAADIYFQSYLDAFGDLKRRGFKMSRFKMGSGHHRRYPRGTQQLEKTVFPKDLSGPLLTAFNKLPTAKKARLLKEGIKIRVKVTYLTHVVHQNYPVMLQSLASQKHGMVLYFGHSIKSKPKRMMKRFFPPKKQAPKHQTFLMLFHCNSKQNSNFIAKNRRGIYAPIGTKTTVFPRFTAGVLDKLISNGVPNMDDMNNQAYANNKSRPWIANSGKKPNPKMLAMAR
ncbi:MAG: hypothetical protein HQ564_09245 [Candidatus Saganbacteria bacterium]|nr:hypothetical protein [Candidatus Saganbacteria bacterium]